MLDGKVAVVTGGSSGIGLAMVERFHAEGAAVVIGDIADEAGTAAAERLGDAASYVHTDVADDAQVGALVAAAVRRYGRLDVMVNNAGASGDMSPLLDFDRSAYDRTLSLLLGSVVSGHAHAARQFRAQGGPGSIISTASAASFQGGWSAMGYTSAKHAVVGVVRQASAELGRYGIRSNAVAPGIILTPILTQGISPADMPDYLALVGEHVAGLQPAGRAGSPADVAKVALFLASDLSEFVTGQTIAVDGGLIAANGPAFGAAMRRAATDWTNGVRATTTKKDG